MAVLSGCGSQSVLLGSSGQHSFVAMDAVALPGETVDLRARLEAGDLLADQPGYVVRFLRGGQLYKAAETQENGEARVAFTPDAVGRYEFSAELSPNGFPGVPPDPRPIVVACIDADAPAMIVDLDKTVVKDGFDEVLIGDPAPMPDSPRVLARLTEAREVIYLTHRPDYFGPKSKAWLANQGYPPGPLLMSDVSGFLGGSGEFKTEAIRRLKERFTGLDLGIGDKISDAQSYRDNGVAAYLILPIPDDPTALELTTLADELGTLDESVQVVTTWKQIERGIYDGAKFPRSEMQQVLLERAAELEPEEAEE